MSIFLKRMFTNVTSRHLKVKSAMTEEKVRPFREMPGPRGLPLIGNLWRFFPIIGELASKDFSELQNELRSQYGNIVRLDGIPTRAPWVLVMDPHLIEQVLLQQGPWPRKHIFSSMEYYQNVTRREWFGGKVGTITTQGKEWKDFRSKVNPFLMRPQAIKKYAPMMNDVASDFVIRMHSLKDEKGEMPADFLMELYKWALESISLVSLDTRLGCLNGNLQPDSDAQRMMNLINAFFETIEILESKISPWRIISTPTWRRYVRTLDEFYGIALKYVREAMERVQQEENIDKKEFSVLESILISNKDPKIAITMALDLLLVGVDTTSHMVATVLYFLAKNQDKQEKLFLEIQKKLPLSKELPITDEILEEMKYLKACIKEAMRLKPTVINNLRNVHTDNYMLGNYRIPNGAFLFLCHMTLSNLEENFPNAGKFIPERWIRDTNGICEAQKANPYVYMPFGHGVRMCIGKRFANMETETLILKVIQNYQLEYSYSDIKFETGILQTIKSPLNFKVINRESTY